MSSSKWNVSMYLLTFFLLFCFTEDIKKKPGEDVLLRCQGPKDADIKMIKWIRPDLKSEGYVYFIRGKDFNTDDQHPSFHGRVELRDPEMKNGDFSVNLKNVNINDAGTYECYVGYGGKPKLINSTILKVEDSGDTAGQTGDEDNNDGGKKDGDNKAGLISLSVGLSVAALVAGVAGFMIFRKHKGHIQQNSDQPPAEAEPELQQLRNDSTPKNIKTWNNYDTVKM